MRRLYLGTSGYAYPHWKELFYPKGLATFGWLRFYAQVFSTVELNTTFYRLPSPEAIERWRSQTPSGFHFACKGSRFLTHMKRLRDTGTGLDRFYERVLGLGPKLSVVLWQLAPQMTKADPDRLDRFLSAQPPGVQQAVEFRHPAWYTEEVCDVLDRRNASFCEHDLVRLRPPRLTGGFRYLRFHGATSRYAGRYGKRGLSGIARSLASWTADGKAAYVYFNNDLSGHAISDALELAELLRLPGVEEQRDPQRA